MAGKKYGKKTNNYPTAGGKGAAAARRTPPPPVITNTGTTSVETISDTKSEFMKLFKKPASAEWVMGLEDEAELAASYARAEAKRRKLLRKHAKRVARGLVDVDIPEGCDVSSDEDDGTFDYAAAANGIFGNGIREKNNTIDKNKNAGGIVGTLLKMAADNPVVDTVKEMADEFKYFFTNLSDVWLKVPLAFFVLATILLFIQHFMVYKSFQNYNHPPNEVTLWRFCRIDTLPQLLLGGFANNNNPNNINIDNNYGGFTLFHFVASLGAMILALQLGAASQSFIAFLGVGCSVLAFAATILDAYLALRACPNGADTSKPCDYPFVSHWVLSFMKNVGTCAAVCLASTVFDLVQKRVSPTTAGSKKSGSSDGSSSSSSSSSSNTVAIVSSPRKTSTIVTGIPLVIYFLYYVLSFYHGVDSGNSTYVTTAGAAAAAKKKGGVKGAGKKGQHPEEPSMTFVESLAYYASFAQFVAWALLVVTIFTQKRIRRVSIGGGAKAKLE